MKKKSRENDEKYWEYTKITVNAITLQNNCTHITAKKKGKKRR